jgi:hypothetical protein
LLIRRLSYTYRKDMNSMDETTGDEHVSGTDHAKEAMPLATAPHGCLLFNFVFEVFV